MVAVFKVKGLAVKVYVQEGKGTFCVSHQNIPNIRV